MSITSIKEKHALLRTSLTERSAASVTNYTAVTTVMYK